MQFSNYLENKIMDKIRGTDFSVAGIYVKLHTGNPGEDCDQNAATHTTRVQGTFGAGASGGVISNTADIVFSSLAADETISHVSLWDASTAGNPLMYGALTTPKDVNAGDTFTIPTGDLDLSVD